LVDEEVIERGRDRDSDKREEEIGGRYRRGIGRSNKGCSRIKIS
jgi:hypothetical protein